MPFDGTTQSLAAKMREILNRGWCKHFLRDRDGTHCLAGAFLAASGRMKDGDVAGRGLGSMYYDITALNKTPELIALSEAVATASPLHKRLHGNNHWNRVATFNNDPATSFEDILKVLDEFEAKENAHVA